MAVEKVPDSVDMWLTLSKFESYKNAKQVLNVDRTIWIAVAKLEESQNTTTDQVGRP